MKYIIAKTWNGFGYSCVNSAEFKEFNSDAEAQEYITQQYNESENADTFDVEVNDGRISYENGEDQGSWQWIKADEDVYGVAIQCNVNEVEALNKDEYFALLSDVIKEADPYDVEEIESMDKVFLGAYLGDYDYQFVKL